MPLHAQKQPHVVGMVLQVLAMSSGQSLLATGSAAGQDPTLRGGGEGGITVSCCMSNQQKVEMDDPIVIAWRWSVTYRCTLVNNCAC